MTELQGITWQHERGLSPMLATAEAYTALHPDVRIQWHVRTLREFGDYPVERLADRFDLLVLDHPFAGLGAETGCLTPLDRYLTPAFLADQAAHSVARSHGSYIWDGHQWALAIDAAAQVSAYRPDLPDGLEPPDSWDEVFALAERARRSGRRIATPLCPTDAFCCFLSLCANSGEEPCATPDHVVTRTTGRYALELLIRLRDAGPAAAVEWNPPAVLDLMGRTDEVVYSPLLFGYSNYGRPGYRPHIVRFTAIPSAGHGRRGGLLGGAGLAISSRTPHLEAAVDYARFVAGAEIQRTLYFTSGGQPGHRAAWTDAANNAASSGFFADTLAALDDSYLRPRYNGYMLFQDQGFALVGSFVRDPGDPDLLLDRLDAAYRAGLGRRGGE